MTYIEIDLHKEFLQVEAMDDEDKTLFNEKITNTRRGYSKNILYDSMKLKMHN